eukprot:COSAG06_NODE_44097_length_366_cov_0.771536_1_plen_82_part_01
MQRDRICSLTYHGRNGNVVDEPCLLACCTTCGPPNNSTHLAVPMRSLDAICMSMSHVKWMSYLPVADVQSLDRVVSSLVVLG